MDLQEKDLGVHIGRAIESDKSKSNENAFAYLVRKSVLHYYILVGYRSNYTVLLAEYRAMVHPISSHMNRILLFKFIVGLTIHV